SYSQVFRAPTNSDLFGGQVTAPEFFDVDPCSGHAGDPAYPGCAGLPPGYTQPPGELIVLLTTGGNPAVEPESGTTWTTGFTYGPNALPGFGVSVDYFDIQLDDTIGTVSAPDIFQSCATSADPLICDLMERDPQTGEITRASEIVRNLGGASASGIDVELA